MCGITGPAHGPRLPSLGGFLPVAETAGSPPGGASPPRHKDTPPAPRAVSRRAGGWRRGDGRRPAPRRSGGGWDQIKSGPRLRTSTEAGKGAARRRRGYREVPDLRSKGAGDPSISGAVQATWRGSKYSGVPMAQSGMLAGTASKTRCRGTTLHGPSFGMTVATSMPCGSSLRRRL